MAVLKILMAGIIWCNNSLIFKTKKPLLYRKAAFLFMCQFKIDQLNLLILLLFICWYNKYRYFRVTHNVSGYTTH
jgi:hypothetical protein